MGFFSALATSRPAAAAPTLVDSLPGFDGALPFRLETGYVSPSFFEPIVIAHQPAPPCHGSYVTVDEENGAELFTSSSRRATRSYFGSPAATTAARSNLCCPLKFVIEPYDRTGTTVPRLQYNPYSWTKAASVLFLDSPVGAGFSFSRNPNGYDVGDVSSSLQVKKFVTKWFTEHPDYLANPFYVGGASRVGKVVPFIAQKISEGGVVLIIATLLTC
ncbi:hypothetical protein ACQ4PT_039977 [Festuca glaucescens]